MEKIWTTGITVKNGEEGWLGECKWQCGEFGKSGSMEGEIFTKYYEPTLEQAIDYVLDIIKRFDIKRSDEVDGIKEVMGFSLYHDEEQVQTRDILDQIKAEATKRGWKAYID